MITLSTAPAAALLSQTTGQVLTRSGLVVAVLLVLLLVLGLMWRSWRAKRAAQADWPAPEPLPRALHADRPSSQGWRLAPTEARYLGSSLASDWLARVVVHDLGVPSRAGLAVDDAGVWIEREGARSFLVPASALIDVRADRGIAGRAYEHGGVTVVTWSLGNTVVDTGFRIVTPERQAEVIAAVRALAGTTQPTSGGSS